MSPDFSARSIKTSSIWQESIARNLSWICIDRGRIWKGDILIADLEDLEKLDASDVYPRRLNAKDVLISQEGDEFIFPAADGTAKMSGRDHELREPTLRREQSERSEDFSGELQGELGRVSTDRIKRMTLEPVPTSGRLKVTSSVVITLNLEFNSMCRRKKNSPFH